MVRMYLCCRCIRHDIGTFGGCFDTEGLPLAWWWMTARVVRTILERFG